ncbi:hypothetical protein OG422_30365 [Streptomyces sp. NBC_01525]|uniref:hypothetical protein n=1 Tax=Streptomyces sp. NBC_01525 TaxID=2903893 RepID=UPI00386D8D08
MPALEAACQIAPRDARRLSKWFFERLSAGLVAESGGGLVVVAERVRDDGGGQFEELLANGRAAGRGGRDPA